MDISGFNELNCFWSSVIRSDNHLRCAFGSAVGIVSILPGMIDTNLQREARNQDKATFPSAELFGMVKDAGMLSSPEETAQQIIEFLLKKDFEHGAVVDIYDYSKVQHYFDASNETF